MDVFTVYIKVFSFFNAYIKSASALNQFMSRQKVQNTHNKVSESWLMYKVRIEPIASCCTINQIGVTSSTLNYIFVRVFIIHKDYIDSQKTCILCWY